MNNKLIIGLVALVIVAVSFYGGMTYAKSKGPVQNGQFVRLTNGQGGRGMRNGMGFNAGEIISKDATSLTIKAPDGSTKIVLISTSTEVMKTVAGGLSDLITGTNVLVNGQANADGSLTVSSIQIRPAGGFFASTTSRQTPY